MKYAQDLVFDAENQNVSRKRSVCISGLSECESITHSNDRKQERCSENWESGEF